MSDIGLMLLLGAVLLVLLGAIRFFSWLTQLQEEHGSLPRAGVHAIQRYVVVKPVKTSDSSDAVVMSRVQNDEAPSNPSSLQTDGRQTADRQQTSKPTAEELLTLYRLMRKAGIGREDAAAAFKASGLPFNNNVWAKAAPPVEEHITPIANRPTKAVFESDPELAYQPPD